MAPDRGARATEEPAHIARLLAVAEELARIGSWELDLVGGVPTWSPELYGGSMKSDNAGDLLALPDCDGGLVGDASLDPDSFSQIIGLA
jgi:triosephosphate isomerase